MTFKLEIQQPKVTCKASFSYICHYKRYFDIRSVFSDYPLEQAAIGISMFNPIDLGRILITLQMDIAALMGYTGAVFRKTIGSGGGLLLAWAVLLFWAILPVVFVRRRAYRKDF